MTERVPWVYVSGVIGDQAGLDTSFAWIGEDRPPGRPRRLWARRLLDEAARGDLPGRLTREHVAQVAASPDPEIRVLAPLFLAYVAP